MLTQEYLKECLNYNPETGVFTWKERPEKHFKRNRDFKMWNTMYKFTVAGSPSAKGYIRIRLKGKDFFAHRIAWLYVYGKFPDNQIDHKDQNKINNRINNLRDATNQVNSQNITNAKRSNMSSLRGVKKCSHGKYQARIFAGGVEINLGMFYTPQQAHAAYLEAKKIHHKGYIHD